MVKKTIEVKKTPKVYMVEFCCGNCSARMYATFPYGEKREGQIVLCELCGVMTTL